MAVRGLEAGSILYSTLLIGQSGTVDDARQSVKVSARRARHRQTHTAGLFIQHSAARHTAIPKTQHANDTKTLVQRETVSRFLHNGVVNISFICFS